MRELIRKKVGLKSKFRNQESIRSRKNIREKIAQENQAKQTEEEHKVEEPQER